jgi:hypothetical protein
VSVTFVITLPVLLPLNTFIEPVIVCVPLTLNDPVIPTFFDEFQKEPVKANILSPDVPLDPLDPLDPDEPDVPDEPLDPLVPLLPLLPLVPFEPALPLVPEVPEDPLEPDEPEVPEDPLDPLVPELPLLPEEPVEPEDPDAPLLPLEPDVPAEPLVPGDPLNPEVPDEPDVPTIFSLKTLYVSVRVGLSITKYVPATLPVNVGNCEIFMLLIFYIISVSVVKSLLSSVLTSSTASVCIILPIQSISGKYVELPMLTPIPGAVADATDANAAQF